MTAWIDPSAALCSGIKWLILKHWGHKRFKQNKKTDHKAALGKICSMSPAACPKLDFMTSRTTDVIHGHPNNERQPQFVAALLRTRCKTHVSTLILSRAAVTAPYSKAWVLISIKCQRGHGETCCSFKPGAVRKTEQLTAQGVKVWCDDS